MELMSPYLIAIQNLNGSTPAEKYKSLNEIVMKIASNPIEYVNEKSFNNPLAPLIDILVAKHLHSNEGVVKGLFSEDETIINHALRARFFFEITNPLLNVTFFKEHILPFISIRTRNKIIKKLALGLSGHERKAQEFFEIFIELYGASDILSKAIPLLIICYDDYIYDCILKYDITLSEKVIRKLYRKKADLVIRYLKSEQCWIYDLHKFLPNLIKNHIGVLIPLCDEVSMKLSKKQTKLFIQNAAQNLLDNPEIFFDFLDNRTVAEKLSTSQFKKMFSNLHPKKSEYSIINIIDRYLKFYPEDKIYELLVESYKSAYQDDLVINTNKIHTKISNSYDISKLLILMPLVERHRAAAVLLDLDPGCTDRNEVEIDWRCYVEPTEAFIILTNDIQLQRSKNKRLKLLHKIIYNCSIHKDLLNLERFLKYLNQNYKNEKDQILINVVRQLTNHFDLRIIGNNNWIQLEELFYHINTRNNFYNGFQPFSEKRKIIDSWVYNIMTESKEDKRKLRDVFEFITEFLLQIVIKDYSEDDAFCFVKDFPKMEQQAIESFIDIIPKKCKEHNYNAIDQEKILLRLLSSITDFNRRNFPGSIGGDEKGNQLIHKRKIDLQVLEPPNTEVFKINRYPTLISFINMVVRDFGLSNGRDKMSDGENVYCSENLISLKQYIYNLDKEFSNSFLGNHEDFITDEHDDIDIIKAISELCNLPNKVSNDWEYYLSTVADCFLHRNNKKIARKFLQKCKFYQNIPVDFMNYSMNICKNKTNYIPVLALLLESEIFFKIFKSYFPEENENLKEEGESELLQIRIAIAKSMIYIKPSIALEISMYFCHANYSSIVVHTLPNIYQRAPPSLVLRYCKELTNSNQISVKKYGIRMMISFLKKSDIFKCLENLWLDVTDKTTRDMIVSEIFSHFIAYPDQKNWMVVEQIINTVSSKNKNKSLLAILVRRISEINEKYAGLYFTKVFNQIEKLTDGDLILKREFIIQIISNMKLLNCVPESYWISILEKYFNYEKSNEICNFINRFAVSRYLISSEEKFLTRFHIIQNLIMALVQKCSTPDTIHISQMKENLQSCLITLFDTLYEIKLEENRNIIIKNFDEIFFIKIKPFEIPDLYIKLQFFPIFRPVIMEGLKITENMGVLCCEKIKSLVTEFQSELILYEIEEYFVSLLRNSQDCERIHFCHGLIQDEYFYGNLIAIMLLEDYFLGSNDKSYKIILENLCESVHPMIRCRCNQLLKKQSDYGWFK